MFFDSKDFKYLEAGVRLTTQQQDLHLQNIANVDTPGYKAKSLSFGEVFKSAREGSDMPDSLNARVVSEDSSVRPDENNVDFEAENIELYKAYAQYSLLLDKVKSEFNKFDFVLNSNFK